MNNLIDGSELFPKKICLTCGGLMKFTGVVLTSNPPQYPYKCENCGNIISKLETITYQTIK